jgi:histidine triad (HIT) family protein
VSYSYHNENIFAKILRGEIPNKTVMETEHTLAFEDIAPKAPHHVLVIPKGPYVSMDHFAKEASDAEIVDLNRTIAKICDQLGVSIDQGNGFRLIANAGPDGVQEVPHFNFHILAGRNIGPMVKLG